MTATFADDGNVRFMILGLSSADGGNDGWDCENCRHLTVVGLHDTGP